ncbi:MAG: R-phenyllactate dehydratase beta subunit [Deltaproteobacteria bacterium ADurb.Bin207]|nr:MAG: R-phenyllactate dehydratase beta subunit [Deltaproteobacteria bacterium ADurb.Bin207]
MLAYLESQKQQGRPIVLAFPILYPREIVTALGACAWEIWSQPLAQPIGSETNRLQAYVCPMVRSAQQVLSSIETIHPRPEAAILPHTCDSMQGLLSIALSTPAWDLPFLPFRYPRGSHGPASTRFLREEVLAFIASLEKALHRTLDPDSLQQALNLQEQKEDRLRTLLESLRYWQGSDIELYAALRSLEYLHPHDAIPLLDGLLSRVDRQKARTGVGIVISGMIPEPVDLFDILEDAGGYVAADDYASIGRRLPSRSTARNADPITSVVQRLQRMPPCPTRCSEVQPRIEYLRNLARASGARGIVFHTVKFCEPELFDVASIRKALGEDGLSVLHLETEFEAHATGQMATRLEAFIEMLGQGKAS